MSKRLSLILPDEIYEEVEVRRKPEGKAEVKRNTYLVFLIKRGLDAEKK